MKKKIITTILGVSISLTFSVGSAFGASKIGNTIDNLLDIPYKYGGSTTKGFDCSGFTKFVFGKFEIELPRSSASQFDIGETVSKDELRFGDLIFFDTSGNNEVSHVGIYIGDDKFAHASNDKGTCIDKLSMDYYKKRYIGARRVMSVQQYDSLATDS